MGFAHESSVHVWSQIAYQVGNLRISRCTRCRAICNFCSVRPWNNCCFFIGATFAFAISICNWPGNYDNLSGAADWARESLEAHADDVREWSYSVEELEKGKTHEDLWNAAQLQLVTPCFDCCSARCLSDVFTFWCSFWRAWLFCSNLISVVLFLHHLCFFVLTLFLMLRFDCHYIRLIYFSSDT